MSEPDPTADAETPLRLDRKLDTTAAKPLAAAFQAVRGSDVAIDASEVSHLGAQCAQVLLSARATWRAEHRGFRIAARSDAFDDGVRLLGLTAAFEE